MIRFAPVLALVLAASLAGCAPEPSGGSEQATPSAPAESPQTESPSAPVPEPDFTPSATLTADGNLDLVTFGSSSCVPTIGTVTAPAADKLRVELQTAQYEVCTADYGPQENTLKLPTEASGRPLEVTLVWVDEAGTDDLVLTAK